MPSLKGLCIPRTALRHDRGRALTRILPKRKRISDSQSRAPSASSGQALTRSFLHRAGYASSNSAEPGRNPRVQTDDNAEYARPQVGRREPLHAARLLPPRTRSRLEQSGRQPAARERPTAYSPTECTAPPASSLLRLCFPRALHRQVQAALDFGGKLRERQLQHRLPRIEYHIHRCASGRP